VLDPLADILNLSLAEAIALTAICLLAGVVRGFSGFALSALVMSSAVLILPPIQLIPICTILETAASILMIRGGAADGNRKMVALLTAGVVVGTPIGLWLTTSLDVETSKMLALSVILCLAALQLGRVRIPGLASNIGTSIAGLVSGIVSGIASVGGMVVALFVLAQNAPARSMRATLVLYLGVTLFVSYAWFFFFGVMTEIALIRGLIMAVPASIGVLVGTRLFTPKYEHLYRPFCLSLLIGLATVGLVRIAN
jgi:uncharacterized membrane protein YfcA